MDRYWQIGLALGAVVALITFLGCWWYAISQWGFLLGVAFGWVVAAIIAAMAGALTALLWGPALVILVLMWIYSMGAH